MKTYLIVYYKLPMNPPEIWQGPAMDAEEAIVMLRRYARNVLWKIVSVQPLFELES